MTLGGSREGHSETLAQRDEQNTGNVLRKEREMCVFAFLNYLFRKYFSNYVKIKFSFPFQPNKIVVMTYFILNAIVITFLE